MGTCVRLYVLNPHRPYLLVSLFDPHLKLEQLLDASQPPICLEARVLHVHEAMVWTYPCHSDGGNQKWTYNPHTKLLKHLHGLCLASSPHTEPNHLPMVSRGCIQTNYKVRGSDREKYQRLILVLWRYLCAS